jgi:hypothetical protein
MSKFMYLYKGPASEMSEEQGAAWGAWMGQVGAALVDMGAPFAGGTVVVDDGSTGKLSNFTGYSIVEATNLQAAEALTKGNPVWAGKKGQYSIEIFELGTM